MAPTDHRARGTAAQRTCAGPGLVVAFGRLTSDRATDGPDSATDDGTRRATDRGSDGCPGQGAPAGTERLGAMLVGVYPGVVDGPAPIHRPVHRAVHLVPIEGRIERDRRRRRCASCRCDP
jgi:hypothetical protein